MNAIQLKANFEARLKTVNELRALAERTQNRALTGEEQATETRLNAAIIEYDQRITNGLAAMERQNAMDAASNDGMFRPTSISGARTADPAVTSFLRGETRVLDVNLGPAIEQRDLVKGTTTAGGYVVPTTMGNLWEHLVDSAAVLQTNVTVLNTASGEDLLVPKTTGYSTAVLIAEAAPIGESDPTFGQVTLNAYKYGMMIQPSSELMFDASIDTAGFLARECGTALGVGIGAAFAVGTGTGQPMGVVPASTVGKTTAAVAAVTADELIDLYHSVIPAYRANASWIFNDSTIAAIRKLKDTTNQYIWQPGLVAGQPDELFGKPVYSDPNYGTMATGVKFGTFGDMSRFVVRFAGPVRFERSDDYAFANDLVTFRSLVRVDSDITDTTAIKHIKNA